MALVQSPFGPALGDVGEDSPPKEGIEFTRLRQPGTPCGTTFVPSVFGRSNAVEMTTKRGLSPAAAPQQTTTQLTLANPGAGHVSCGLCKQTLAMSMCIQKGGQWWCYKDNQNYNALQLRWAKNSKLKTWFQALAPEEKVKWFIKWQSMDKANRFDECLYEENSIEQVGNILDEVETWEIWDDYYDRNIRRPGETDQTVRMSWQGIIDTNQANCLWHRNQWHVPKYCGLEGRKRKANFNDISVTRKAKAEDPNVLMSMLAAGRNSLQRFAAGIRPSMCAKQLGTDPEVTSRPEDQPQIVPAADIMCAAVAREVTVNQRDEAQKRAQIAAEILEANEYVKEQADEADEGEESTDSKLSGVARAKLEGLVNCLKQELQDLREKIDTDTKEVCERIRKELEDSDAASPARAPGAMRDEITDSAQKAKEYLNSSCDTALKSFSHDATSAKTMKQFKAVGALASIVRKGFKADRVRSWASLMGSTKKYLTSVSKQKTKKQPGAARAEEAVTAPAAPIIAVGNALFESHGDIMMCSKSIFEAKCGVRAAELACLSNKNLYAELSASNFVKKAMKDLVTHLANTGKQWSHYVFEESGPNGKRVNSMIKKSLNPQVRTKLVLPDLDWGKRIFAPDLVGGAAGAASISPSQFCMTEARVVLLGSQLVFGMPIDKINGDNAAEKRACLEHMTIDQLTHLFEVARGWITKLNPGDMLLIPSGHMVVCGSTEGSVTLRWAVSGDDPECSRVREMLKAQMDAFSELRSPVHCYAQLHEFLVDQGY